MSVDYIHTRLLNQCIQEGKILIKAQTIFVVVSCSAPPPPLLRQIQNQLLVKRDLGLTHEQQRHFNEQPISEFIRGGRLHPN
jgi:hypothetical protein